ncbi:hypothetical protein D5272_10090 [bacterium D16-76]|nr:hypothetical protein [bacterium D16-76]
MAVSCKVKLAPGVSNRAFYASGGLGASPLKAPQTLLKKGLILKLILQIYWVSSVNSAIWTPPCACLDLAVWKENQRQAGPGA